MILDVLFFMVAVFILIGIIGYAICYALMKLGEWLVHRDIKSFTKEKEVNDSNNE